MNERIVILTAQTIVELFRDYLGPDYIPDDSVLHSIQYKATEKGKIALVIESKEWKNSDPLYVNFDLSTNFSLVGEKSV